MKAYWTQIKTGVIAYYRSFEFIAKHGMWLYFLIPAILSGLLWWGGDVALRDIRTISFSDLPKENFEYELLFTGLQSIFVFVSIKMNKYLVMILLSPVLTQLSAKAERILSGNLYPFGFRQYLHNLLRGLQIAFRNMLLQMLIMAFWLVLTLVIPPLQFATGVVVFLVGFYFYGFYFMDYVSERLGYTLEQSISFIRKNAVFAFSIGGIFSLIFLIPYAGVIVGPITASIAATIGVDMVVGLKDKIRRKAEESVEAMDPVGKNSGFVAK